MVSVNRTVPVVGGIRGQKVTVHIDSGAAQLRNAGIYCLRRDWDGSSGDSIQIMRQKRTWVEIARSHGGKVELWNVGFASHPLDDDVAVTGKRCDKLEPTHKEPK